jgi:hypothetical protein
MSELPEPGLNPHFHELAALVQEGIDGARLALSRAQVGASGESARALAQVDMKLDEAELWLGRALELGARG